MKYRLLLLLASLIWGCAFVAQVVGMESLGPFSFNAVRFLIGSASLIPVLFFLPSEKPPKAPPFPFWVAALLAGAVLFGGAALQQNGLLYTTASKASFITALYILLVPIFGLFFGHELQVNHAIGAVAAIIGIYLLSVTESFEINTGDLLVFLCAFFFTAHILLLAYLVERFSPVQLACGQFFVCGLLNLCFTGGEGLSFESIRAGLWPLLYGGILSAGVAYTLQVVGQRHLPPTEASMILSMEMIFGALSGVLFLGESMTGREVIGALLMIFGTFLSQISSPVLFSPHFWKSRVSAISGK